MAPPPIPSTSFIKEKYGILHVILPSIAALTQLIGFIIFVLSIHHYPNVPIYAPVCLIWGAALNLVGAVPHWLLPDAGLESVAQIDLGKEPSKARVAAIFVHSEEGLNRIYLNALNIFIAVRYPELSFQFLMINFIFQLTMELSTLHLKNLVFDGERLGKSAPGQLRFLLAIFPDVAPILVGAWRGDFRLNMTQFITEGAEATLISNTIRPYQLSSIRIFIRRFFFLFILSRLVFSFLRYTLFARAKNVKKLRE